MTGIYYFRRPYTTFGVYILFLAAMYYFLQLYTTFEGYIPHSMVIYYFRRLYPNGHIFVDLPWIWRRNSTWKVRGNYIDFERRMDKEIMTSIRRGYFDVDSTFKIDEISMGPPRGFFYVVSTSNRHNFCTHCFHSIIF